MPLNFSDELRHNNVNAGLADTDFIKGGTRTAVSSLTELYQLSAKSPLAPTYIGQLKDFATRVWVRSEGKYYTLVNEASARKSEGWVTDNILLSGVINPGVFDTTVKYVSASDGVLSVNYLTKAENSNGINESIIYDDGTNIGIGETSPEGKLHVKAGSSGTVTAQPNSIGIFENSGNSYISVLSPNSQYAGLVMGGPGNPYGSYVSWNHDNNALKVATAHSGGAIQLLVNAEQEAVRILSGGNVGIGTINPKEKLTISGNLSSSGTATIGTIATNNTNTSFVVESNGLLQKRTLNAAVGNTTAVFVSASDGALSVNYLTKATNSNGIDESIISDNGSLVYVGGNVTISGNLTALGNSYFANTLFTTTSSISVVNYGPGPAIYAFQSSGNQDIASFYDGDGVEVLHVGNCPPGELYGKVGINVSEPNKELTVKGSVSASGTLNVGTINTNTTSDSIVVLGTNNILEKRTIDSRAWGSSLVDGTGTTNYITKWSDSTTVTNSIVFDNGTNVGIGTTTPGAKLTVSGTLSTSSTVNVGGIGTGTDNSVVILDASGFLRTDEIDSRVWGSSLVDGIGTANRVAYWTDSNTISADSDFFFDGTNVGIGTTSPNEKLTVVGNISAAGNHVFSSNSASDALRITQTGSGNALVVEDSANPDATPFIVGNDGRVYLGSTQTFFNASLIIERPYQQAAQAANIYARSNVNSSNTTIANGVQNVIVADAGNYTIPSVNCFFAESTNIRTLGVSATRVAGFLASSTLSGAGINNYGFLSDIDESLISNIQNYNFYADGTAKNYFAGNVGIGTDTPDVKLDVNGVIRSATNTVTPAATTALPSSNDVILNNQTGPVTITAFSGGIAGVTYTITNKSTHAVTLDTSASLFVRGGNSWASHKCTTNAEGYIVLPQNFSCSLRMDSATTGSAW